MSGPKAIDPGVLKNLFNDSRQFKEHITNINESLRLAAANMETKINYEFGSVTNAVIINKIAAVFREHYDVTVGEKDILIKFEKSLA